MLKNIEKLKTTKTLFVEDEKDLLEIICNTFEKLKCPYSFAKNGEEALKILKEDSQIKIVVTDINMPIMNGLDLLKSIKEEILDRHIIVIVMSAHTEYEYLKKAQIEGAYEYLVKPFDFIKFINLVSKLDLENDELESLIYI
jgi:DNA-binding NtrC family response regulator